MFYRGSTMLFTMTLSLPEVTVSSVTSSSSHRWKHSGITDSERSRDNKLQGIRPAEIKRHAQSQGGGGVCKQRAPMPVYTPPRPDATAALAWLWSNTGITSNRSANTLSGRTCRKNSHPSISLTGLTVKYNFIFERISFSNTRPFNGTADKWETGQGKRVSVRHWLFGFLPIMKFRLVSHRDWFSWCAASFHFDFNLQPFVRSLQGAAARHFSEQAGEIHNDRKRD